MLALVPAESVARGQGKIYLECIGREGPDVLRQLAHWPYEDPCFVNILVLDDIVNLWFAAGAPLKVLLGDPVTSV